MSIRAGGIYINQTKQKKLQLKFAYHFGQYDIFQCYRRSYPSRSVTVRSIPANRSKSCVRCPRVTVRWRSLGAFTARRCRPTWACPRKCWETRPISCPSPRPVPRTRAITRASRRTELDPTRTRRSSWFTVYRNSKKNRRRSRWHELLLAWWKFKKKKKKQYYIVRIIVYTHAAEIY